MYGMLLLLLLLPEQKNTILVGEKSAKCTARYTKVNGTAKASQRQTDNNVSEDTEKIRI